MREARLSTRFVSEMRHVGISSPQQLMEHGGRKTPGCTGAWPARGRPPDGLWEVRRRAIGRGRGLCRPGARLAARVPTG
jgi:hypothetical protein